MLALSVASAFPERTLSGSDSRLPPQTDAGAKARTEASVSMLRRRRFDDEARVTMLASSVSTFGWFVSVARWRGIADAALRVDGAGETGY